MSRDPSLHVKLSDLITILGKVLPEGVDVKGFALALLKHGRPYSLNTRIISVTTERLENKVNKILMSPTKDADLMARVIYAVRVGLHHKGVRQIKPASREWGIVKELASLANNFCLDFDKGKKDGYTVYIKLAIAKMKAFNLNRISSMHEAICRTYEALLEIKDDPDPALSESIHQYYRVKVAKKTGIINNFKDEPDKYVYFVRVAALVKSLTVKYQYFIDAQFDAMEYRNSMPEPPQLIGQKAKERLNKWLYEKGIRV